GVGVALAGRTHTGTCAGSRACGPELARGLALAGRELQRVGLRRIRGLAREEPGLLVAERLQLRAHAQVGTCTGRSCWDEGYRSHDGEQTGAQAPGGEDSRPPLPAALL